MSEFTHRMERRIVRTADGSPTIQLPDWQEQYHSMHGAIQESYHVFIREGLLQYKERELDILEMGFGTGLNAFITMLETPSRELDVRYTSLEAYPLPEEEWSLLDYGSRLDRFPEAGSHFEKLHRASWEVREQLTSSFSLHKIKTDFLDFAAASSFDIVFFDAFGARVQPELWTEAVFARMFEALRPGGILVTYSAKGSVRRAMQAVGFLVERLPGPPGKREMLRARKPF